MNSVSLLLIASLGLAISFSAPAKAAPTAERASLQADESYIYRNVKTPFSPLQLTRILELTTFFENSEIRARYNYIENLNDGRGFTAGRIGFCTGTGDLSQVVDSYCLKKPAASICRYQNRLHEIKDVADKNEKPNPDVRGLAGFTKVWTTTSRDKAFQRLQDNALIAMYLNPALSYFKKQNLKWPLTLAALYDTFIQHGEEGPDGFKFIFDKTNDDLSGRSENEKQWLNQFLDNRIQILLNPSNTDSTDEWRESVDRAYKLKDILNKDGNAGLNRPVRFNAHTQTD